MKGSLPGLTDSPEHRALLSMRLSGQALRDAVKQASLAEFTALHGRAWRELDGQFLRPRKSHEGAHAAERAARAALVLVQKAVEANRLAYIARVQAAKAVHVARAAAKAAKDFDLDLPTLGEGAVAIVRELRIKHGTAILELLAEAELFDRPLPRARTLNVRAAVATTLQRSGIRIRGELVRLDLRQLACIALLCDSWPAGGAEPRRVEDVIEAEERAIAMIRPKTIEAYSAALR